MKKLIPILFFPLTILASNVSPSVYKVLTEPEWKAFKEKGTFPGSPVDIKDGFIHLSSKKQLEGVIVRYFANQRPIYIVKFSEKAFGESLRWEPATDGEKFPHVYGRPLTLRDVLSSDVRR